MGTSQSEMSIGTKGSDVSMGFCIGLPSGFTSIYLVSMPTGLILASDILSRWTRSQIPPNYSPFVEIFCQSYAFIKFQCSFDRIFGLNVYSR